jgi:hypothetical protein
MCITICTSLSPSRGLPIASWALRLTYNLPNAEKNPDYYIRISGVERLLPHEWFA